jgi:radical SAM superfamily enzyme YgiQ (UPF0313 family)
MINPSLGEKKADRQDRLRGYLSLGTMASALRSADFLEKLSARLGIDEENREKGPFHVRIVDLSDKPQEESIHSYLESILKDGPSPLLVCMTATSAQLDEARSVARAAARIVPEALRIVGGPHVSVLPASLLEDFSYPVACMGEGVETLAEIALRLRSGSGIDFSRIAGIAFREMGGSIRVNFSRQFAFGLDGYPFPSDSLDLFLDGPLDGHGAGDLLVYLYAGSGCPFQCIFCAQHAIHGGRIRERSAESLFAEIQGLCGKGFTRFALVQETFFNRRERTERFFRLVAASGLKFEWTVEARVDQLDFSLLQGLSGIGLRMIQIGLESGDQELSDTLEKRVDLVQAVRVRDWCEALGISTVFYMLVGLPGQGWQSVLRSADFFRKHPPHNPATMHMSVSVAIPYPGTRIAAEESVRLVRSKGQWPARNPRVELTEEGVLQGENPTETDAMTPEEILSAFVCLDDLGYFVLHARHDPTLSPARRADARTYAEKLFSMIQRRTVRDLVVCAQESLTPQKRLAAYREIRRRDGPSERSFTRAAEPLSETFVAFLSRVRFENGFHTMKILSMEKRIRWMQLCALVWDSWGRRWFRFRLQEDQEAVGRVLNSVLAFLDSHDAPEETDQGGRSLRWVTEAGEVKFEVDGDGIRIRLNAGTS